MKGPADDIVISPIGVASAIRGGLEAVAPVAADSSDDAVERAVLRAGLEAALACIEDGAEDSAAMFAPDHGPTSLLLSFLAERAEEQRDELAAASKLVALPGGGHEVKFDERDFLGWAGSLFTWWRRVLAKHPFIGPPEAPDWVIPDHARIAVLGDWGSGRYGAPVSAATIERHTPSYDMLVHLGDVYYSGTPREIQQRFLAIWPKVPGALSRALNSNHEMYSGGHGYFGLTLPAFRQQSSCFAVENAHFLLVGLDTGYDEHDLTHHQVPWLERLVRGAVARHQRVVLFSHHQLFSSFEKQGELLERKLRPLLAANLIFAWYWGHEHRCALFDPHPHWGLHARLVGHSGFPYFRDRVLDRPLVHARDPYAWRRIAREGVPDALLLDGPNPHVPGKEDRYGPQGHMTLELIGPVLRETVHAPDGTVLLENEIGG